MKSCRDCRATTGGLCVKHFFALPPSTWMYATPRGQQPFLCPVCAGKGLVPAGFYEAIGVKNWRSDRTAPDKCRACGGKGLVWQRAAAAEDFARRQPAAAD